MIYGFFDEYDLWYKYNANKEVWSWILRFTLHVKLIFIKQETYTIYVPYNWKYHIKILFYQLYIWVFYMLNIFKEICSFLFVIQPKICSIYSNVIYLYLILNVLYKIFLTLKLILFQNN